VGKNGAKRKGFASLPPNSAEAFKRDEGQTLLVNAAIKNEKGEAENLPWMVELELAVKYRY
jgi:hypothetical protein